MAKKSKTPSYTKPGKRPQPMPRELQVAGKAKSGKTPPHIGTAC